MPSVGISQRRRNPSFVLFVISAFSMPCSVCVPHSTVNSSTQQAVCSVVGAVTCSVASGENTLERINCPVLNTHYPGC